MKSIKLVLDKFPASEALDDIDDLELSGHRPAPVNLTRIHEVRDARKEYEQALMAIHNAIMVLDASVVDEPENIQKVAWPNGAILTCAKCSRRSEKTPEQMERYLAKWPKCCGIPAQVKPL